MRAKATRSTEIEYIPLMGPIKNGSVTKTSCSFGSRSQIVLRSGSHS